MKFQSRKVQLDHSQKETFEYLNKVENYEKLVPDTAEFIPHESGEGFAVQLKGLPKVGLKKKSVEAPQTISFESPNDMFDYDLVIDVTSIDENKSEVLLDFDGRFNPMIEMMAKKPLSKFIETLADNLESKGLS